jgi:hypothetical protein
LLAASPVSITMGPMTHAAEQSPVTEEEVIERELDHP